MKVIQILHDSRNGYAVLGLGDDGLLYIWNYVDARWELNMHDPNEGKV